MKALVRFRYMQLVASPEARQAVQERGGKLYIWAKRRRCCRGALVFLEAATEPPEREFRRVGADGIELWLDASLPREPDELHVELKRRRLEAYWDGCAYVV